MHCTPYLKHISSYSFDLIANIFWPKYSSTLSVLVLGASFNEQPAFFRLYLMSLDDDTVATHHHHHHFTLQGCSCVRHKPSRLLWQSTYLRSKEDDRLAAIKNVSLTPQHKSSRGRATCTSSTQSTAGSYAFPAK